jgi:HK97 family phage portal protein
MANPFAVAARSVATPLRSAPGSLQVEAKSLDIFYRQSSIPQSLTVSRTSGLHSNVLMSPVMWVMRAFTEAQLVVQRRQVDAGGGLFWRRSLDHAVELLVRRPNSFFTADALWKGTALSYTMAGNAYWMKVRNVFGDVVQLWYVPHWMIRPEGPIDGSEFISHYVLSGHGNLTQLPPRDVVHFKFGVDPENQRLGYSPLQAILQEVLTDDQAAQFSKAILANMGVPGLIVSPKGNYKPKPEERDRLQNIFDHGWSGERRGLAMVMGGETEVSQFGFDPNKLMLANLRDISEERVCAALGIPSAVVGFGSGLQSTKVGATMRELVKLARVQCLNPMFWTFGETVTEQLQTDFVGEQFRQTFRCRFDVSEVSAFQEDAKSEAERIALLVREGILRVDRGQQALGLEVDPSRAVYLKSETVTEPEPPPDEEPDDKPDDEAGEESPTADTDKQKMMLRAIARRHALPAATNGNGKH